VNVRVGDWRPLGPQTQPRLISHDIICYHTMVGTLPGTDAMFRAGGYRGNESHFGVGGDGTTYQWQHTDYQADANLNGNRRIVSIETADMGPEFPVWDARDGAQVPAWTPAQVEELAVITAALAVYYDIPLQLIPDSRPERRGVGYHRLGCDPYRVPGGELWSAAPGKVCPGDRRIAQVPHVIELARQIAAGSTLPTPTAEDTMDLIELRYYDDHFEPDPDGLNFRGSCPAETATNSLVIDRAFVRWVAYWGQVAGWRVVAWNANAPIGEAPPGVDNWELPAGTRGFTVEGRRAHPGVQPAVALLVKGK